MVIVPVSWLFVSVPLDCANAGSATAAASAAVGAARTGRRRYECLDFIVCLLEGEPDRSQRHRRTGDSTSRTGDLKGRQPSRLLPSTRERRDPMTGRSTPGRSL